MSDKASLSKEQSVGKKRRVEPPNDSELIPAIFKYSRWKEIANEFDIHYNTLHNAVKECEWYNKRVKQCRENILRLGREHIDSPLGRFLVQEGLINLNSVVAEKVSNEPPMIYSSGGHYKNNPVNSSGGLPAHIVWRHQQVRGRYGR